MAAHTNERSGRRILVLALSLLVLPCALSAGSEEGWYHRVIRGETLYKIAGAYYGDPNRWVEIQRANPGIRIDAIPEGTVIFIPRGGGSPGAEPLRPAAAGRATPGRPAGESAPGAIVRWIRSGPLRGEGNRTFAAGLALYALPILLFAIVLQTAAVWAGGRVCRIPELKFAAALKVSIVTAVAYAIFATFVVLFGVAFAVVAAPPHREPLGDLHAWLADLLRRPGVGVAVLSLIPVTYAAIGFQTVRRTSNASPGRAAIIAAAGMLVPSLAAAIFLRPFIIP